MTMPSVATLAAWLDDYLRLREVPDEPGAVNGLQVECRGEIGRIVAAVDASQATIDGATALPRSANGGGTLLLVHHGLFWDGNQPVTGRRYRRLRRLLETDTALYSSHIPLDIHPEVGNNITLAKALGLEVRGSFGAYRGIQAGVWGVHPGGPTRERLCEQVAGALGISAAAVTVIPGGPPSIGRVGIITGGAGNQIGAAREAGLDTFITGEGAHHTFFDAMEGGVNVIYAGHYATESLGVQALAACLGSAFGLPWEFHAHPTGL
jgi:dinuclear metal center YbgI/SA1388 family protein